VENSSISNNETKKIKITSDCFVPKNSNGDKDKTLSNFSGNEKRVYSNETSNIDYTTVSSQTNSSQGKSGNVFNRKTEETNKTQNSLKEEKVSENKKVNDPNSTTETVLTPAKEEEKISRPVFINSVKNNDNDSKNTNTGNLINIVKKEENVSKYKIVNEYFKVIDKLSTKTDTKIYDLEYLMKFRNVLNSVKIVENM
jgi:hypothetical protein